jgi:hypothetical protein
MSAYDYAIEYDDSPSPDPFDGYKPDREDDDAEHDEAEDAQAALEQEAYEAQCREDEEANYAYLEPYAAVMVEKFGGQLSDYTPMYHLIKAWYSLSHPSGWLEPAEHVTPNWVMKRADKAMPIRSANAVAEIQSKLIGTDGKLIPTYEIGKLVLETLRRYGLGPEFVPTEDNLGF